MAISASAPSLATARPARFADRHFKLFLVAPSIFVLLLIGIFPLVYLLVVSFQGITMTETDTGFVGLRNYAMLFHDPRLWEALLHTVIFTAIALPIELVLGLAMAQLFLDKLPGRQIFIALLVLPVVVSPIVSGATWSLMFNNRFGPINRSSAGSPAATRRCCGRSARVWSIRRSSSLKCGSGRRSCSCCCSLRSPTSISRSWKRRHRRRGLLAHVLQHRAAGDLAGHGDRHSDSRSRSVPPVRHRVGA